ncbi:MAG: 7,8-dihydro-8-oxoguanine triphosphatase [bacterium P3]|nr:MAG: 7,8-dihydro-8-oxoguanine triphosphatase [bacterium P3]KWW41460.1 MAG: 7,8-dihydro-8-oxoguanine triphosphatase [bacterium F083]
MKQTTLCYLRCNDSYLMLHRVKKDHDASHGKWIGVGGKCERDESPDECMLREVREETGLTVLRWQYRGIVTFISDTWPCEYMHLFTATQWEGTMVPCDEGDLQWVPQHQLEQLNLWEGDRIFLRLLLDNTQPFFSLKLVYRGDALCSAKLDNRPIPLPGCQNPQ